MKKEKIQPKTIVKVKNESPNIMTDYIHPRGIYSDEAIQIDTLQGIEVEEIEEEEEFEFLVVYEDLWSNKDSVRTKKIGDAIKNYVETYELVPENEIDYDKYNSKNPFDIGTMGLGFYDITFNELDGEYAGRIMIFTL